MELKKREVVQRLLALIVGGIWSGPAALFGASHGCKSCFNTPSQIIKSGISWMDGAHAKGKDFIITDYCPLQ